jgi:hypothetical protein
MPFFFLFYYIGGVRLRETRFCGKLWDYITTGIRLCHLFLRFRPGGDFRVFAAAARLSSREKTNRRRTPAKIIKKQNIWPVVKFQGVSKR